MLHDVIGVGVGKSGAHIKMFCIILYSIWNRLAPVVYFMYLLYQIPLIQLSLFKLIPDR